MRRWAMPAMDKKMTKPNSSKRFEPSAVSEKLVPVLLGLLLLVLLSVFVIIGLSLMGGSPSA